MKYILVLAVVLGLVTVSGFLLFFQSLQHIERSATAECYAQLDNYRIEMDSRLREIDSILYQISINQDVGYLAKSDSPLRTPSNLYRFSLLLDTIGAFTISNSFIDDILIHFHSNDVIFTSNRMFLELERCYGDFYSYRDYSAEQWVEAFYGDFYHRQVIPGHPVTLNQHTEDRVVFLQSLTAASYPKPLGVAAISVNASSFSEPISTIASMYEGYGFVMDGDVVIAATNGDLPLAQIEQTDEFLTVEIVSEYNGWRYLLLLPSSSLQKKANQFRSYGLQLMGISTILSVLVMTFFWSGRAMTLSRILHDFGYGKKTVPASNELQFIHHSVSNLIQTNEILSEKVERFRPVLIHEFWENLLKGQITNSEAAQYYLMQMESVELDGNYVVVALRIRGLGDLNLESVEHLNRMKLYLEEAIQKNVEEYIYGCNMGTRILAVICFAPVNEPDFIQVFQKITHDFEAGFGYRLSVSPGGTVNTIWEVFLSYNEARLRLRSSTAPTQSRVADDLSYPVTIMDQSNWVRLLKSGDGEGMTAYIQDTLFARLQTEAIPGWMRTQFLYDALSVLLMAYEEMRDISSFPHEQFKDRAGKIYRSEHIEDQIEQVRELYDLFINAVCVQRAGNGSTLLDKVIPFIQKNLCDYNLSLEMVADHFRISKAYLSGHFKERRGENFTNYIEKLRIETSCAMIRDGQRRISAIAESIGYSGAQVYRRAFKRIMGISPSEYIAAVQKEEDSK